MKTLLPLILLALPAAAQDDAALEWNERAARHLLNRASFGGPALQIHRWAEMGQEAAIERLFEVPENPEPFFVEPMTYGLDRETIRRQGPEAIRKARNDLRERNRRQQQAYVGVWVNRMLEDEVALAERMTLFWHGVFTTQASKVKSSYLLIRQSQLLREHALGNYGEMLRAILRDPAMLVYLDNTSNERGHPNENLGRELLELFSLGEGNYTEEDVQEVARALTGYGSEREQGFVFSKRQHDWGDKTVLGIEARHNLDSVVDVILAQPACGRWIAGQMITYFEGVAPSQERLETYASLLRGGNYEIEPFLRRLFTDPEFYRPEIVGARIQSPVDYLVGSCRRLRVSVHPRMIVAGAALIGEQLLEPPNVKGWEGGEAWITTSTFMTRGNMMGVLLGVVETKDLRAEIEPPTELMAELELGDEEDALSEDGSMEMDSIMQMEGGEMQMESEEATRDPRRRDPFERLVKMLESSGYRPPVNISARLGRSGRRSDREIVDAMCSSLLAIETPLQTRRMLVVFLREGREALGAEEGALLRVGPRAEHLLRRLAHLILSLPEAQLG